MAFLDPVNIATHLKSEEGWSLGIKNLTAVLALILVRSLEMPESA